METAPDGLVFVVGRVVPTWDPEVNRNRDRMHLQGVALSYDIALSMCRDETYFIGPMPANVSLPHSAISWIGLRFPLKRK